jgi:uncharacterized phage-associated protein
MGNLKELTDKELEQLLYEYTHEIYDKRFREKLINEKIRRWKEQ